MARMGWGGRSLGACLMVSLTLMGCATSRRMARPTETAPDPADAAEVARRCDDLVKSLSYAKKSVGGRAAATAILTPLLMGIGLAGVAMADGRGLVVAFGGPAELVKWTAQAGKENTERFDRLRQVCEEGGGADTASTARAVRSLADLRHRERSTRDAIWLYRDSLAILDRAGAGESEDAAATALTLAGLLESKTPADPEVGPLYDRALRIRQGEAETSPRELAAVLVRYGSWLQAGGRSAEAETMQARADALSREAEAAEERSRSAHRAPRAVSVTGIIVAESCAQPGITTLDQLNEEAAAQGAAARIVAATCHEDGRISSVHLNAPAGESNVLGLDDQDADIAERIRPALRASES